MSPSRTIEVYAASIAGSRDRLMNTSSFMPMSQAFLSEFAVSPHTRPSFMVSSGTWKLPGINLIPGKSRPINDHSDALSAELHGVLRGDGFAWDILCPR